MMGLLNSIVQSFQIFCKEQIFLFVFYIIFIIGNYFYSIHPPKTHLFF